MANYDERSPFWGAAATTTLVGGAGYGLYKGRDALGQAWKAGAPDVLSNASSITSGFNTGRIISSQANVLDSTLESVLSTYQGGAARARTDIFSAGYEAILAGGKTEHKTAIDLLEQAAISKQESAKGAFEAASAVVKEAGGDVNLLRSRVESLGNARSAFISDPVVSIASAMEKVTTSPGGYGEALPKIFPTGFDSPALQQRSSEIQRAIGEASQNKFTVDWKYRMAEKTPMMTGRIGGAEFHIPLAETGLTYSGDSLSARYATRKGYMAGGQALSYSELSTMQVADAINRSTTHAEVKLRLQNATQNLIQQMDVRDSQHRAAAVWSLPQPLLPSGGLAKQRFIGKEAVLYGAQSEQELFNLLGKGYYPYTSPGAAGKQILTTSNIVEEIYGPLGTLMGAEENPGQFVRGEWGVTAKAKEQAQGFRGTFGKHYSRLERKMTGPGYKDLILGGKSAMSAEAYTAPQLMTFYAKTQKFDEGFGFTSDALNKQLALEEGVISNKAAGMMEYERITQKRIALNKGLKVNKALLVDQLAGAQPGQYFGFGEGALGASEFVGIEKATGKEIWTSANDFSSRVAGMELAGPDEAIVYMREKHKLTSDAYWKFFSEENKFVATATNEARMREVAQAAGAEDFEKITGQKLEALFSGKLVERNKMALITQQTEAMASIVGKKLGEGNLAGETPYQFLKDPERFLNVKAALIKGTTEAKFQIQKDLVGLSKSFGFSDREMQLTFGLMDTGIAERLGIKSLVEESTGVIGLGKGRLGDLVREGGASRWGSLEQSGFRLLAAKGSEGIAFADELAGRLVDKGELSQADKMLAGVIGQESVLDEIKSVADLKAKAAGVLKPSVVNPSIADVDIKKFIEEGGGYLDLGERRQEFGYSSKMYVPGLQEAPALVEPTIQSGKTVQKPIVQELFAFQKSIKGKSEAEIAATAANLRNTIAHAAEQQWAARGKIVGSGLYKAIGQEYKKLPNVVRMAEEDVFKQFDDLLARAQTTNQKKFLRAELTRLKAGGTAFGGMWRHPTTGAESFQFVEYQIDKSLSKGMIGTPAKRAMLNVEGMGKRGIDVSSMVGFAGDFDNDSFVIAATSNRDTSKRIQKRIGAQAAQGYEDYLFRHHVMEGLIENTKGQGDILDNALVRGYKKLSTAKTETGKVNIALQKLKIGIQKAAPEEYKPLADLYWHIEQAAIGGKHGARGQNLYQDIAESVARKDVGQLEKVMTTLFGEGEQVFKGSIDGRKHSFTLNTRKAAEISISSLEAAGSEVDLAIQGAKFAKGPASGAPSLQAIQETFHTRRSGSIDYAQEFMSRAAGESEGLSRRVSKKMGQAGVRSRAMWSAVKKAKGPMLIGAAAAAGIMLMAPSTSGVIRPIEGPQGGRNLDVSRFGPPSGEPMRPPPPRMNNSPRAYELSSGNQISRANIRMRLNDLNPSSRDFMRSARELANGGQVNIKARDDRSALDPRQLASKIHERL